jgi:hypothetical protein
MSACYTWTFLIRSIGVWRCLVVIKKSTFYFVSFLNKAISYALKQIKKMSEIKCPKCGSVFTVDEANYTSIVNQIKNAEFQEEIEKRLNEIEKQNDLKQKAEILKSEQDFQNKISAKEAELNKKDIEITKLKEQVANISDSKKLEFNLELTKKEQEIDKLKSSLKEKDDDNKIISLKIEQENQQILQEKENQISKLKNDILLEKQSAIDKQKNIEEKHEIEIKQLKDSVNYYKDLKSRMSTKMIGESLEIHCSTEFNKMRSLLPNAYFEKDNDASSGSKGDFIFKDYEDGIEYISIMFEMKNEMDETSTKHKNEDFLKNSMMIEIPKNVNLQSLYHFLNLIVNYIIMG